MAESLELLTSVHDVSDSNPTGGGINQVSILNKSIAGRYRLVRVADGPIMAGYRFM